MTAKKSSIISDETEEQITLPDGWRLVRLGDICNIKGGKRLPSGTDFSPTKTSFPYIRVTDFTNGTIRSTQLKYLHEATQKQIARYIINRDDVYISIAGSIGIVGTIPDELDGANLTENAARLIIDKEKVTRDYLFRFLQSAEGQQQIKQRTNLVGQPKLALERIASIEIPLPSTLEEQRRIGTVLDEQMKAVEQARCAVEKQLTAAKLLPNAFLRSVFESDESNQWKLEKVGNISSLIIDGPHVTPYYVPNGVPFLTVRNIVSRRIDFSLTSFITEADHEEFKKRGKAERGDILYTKDGTLGIPCVVDTDKEFSFFVSVALIKLIREIADPYFVGFALESPSVLEQVKLLGAGAGLKHMVLKSIRSLEIPLPSTIKKQKVIVEKLNEQMQEVESLKKTLIEQLQAIKKMSSALLRKAFTGEI